MQKEELKETYNKRYLLKKDKWSYTNLSRCKRIINKLRAYLYKHKSINQQYKALDVGCAKGCFTEALRQAGFSAYGLDYSDVAISKAKQLYPQCTFLCTDGFNPDINEKFDLIFIRGFSGCNAYDFTFLANMLNQYIDHLNTNGYLVVSYASDFSGTSIGEETANWSQNQISSLCESLNAKKISIIYLEEDLRNKLIRAINIIRRHKNKKQFYIVLQQYDADELRK